MSDFDNISDFEDDPGLIYRPAPQIVPDTQTGFSANGDWHVAMEYLRGDHDPNGAAMDPGIPRTLPYRMAHEIQEVIEQRASTEDHDIGLIERAEWAEEYANMLIGQNADDSLALSALAHWRRTYGC